MYINLLFNSLNDVYFFSLTFKLIKIKLYNIQDKDNGLKDLIFQD